MVPKAGRQRLIGALATPGRMRAGLSCQRCAYQMGGESTRGSARMGYYRLRRMTWLVSTLLTVCLALPAATQQATRSDADLIQEGPLGLAAAHWGQTRHCGKVLIP